MTLLRIFGIFLAVFSIWAGSQNTAKLFVALTPKNQFSAVEGQVHDVLTQIDSSPGYGMQLGTNNKVYEVLFSYQSAGKELIMNTLSPLCTYCPAEDITLATGVQPSQLTKGTSVTVLVDKNNPSRAYLMLPSNKNLWKQAFVTIVWLLVCPAFVWIFVWSWERKNAV